MRRVYAAPRTDHKILVVDDEIGVIDSLTVVFRRFGYSISGCTNPLEAVERVRNEHFDLMILDFMMTPIHGDQVVARIREFNRDLYILLLTGYKDLAPPLETIRTLDIQGYCEKSDRFDQLVLLVESGIKCITQINTIRTFKDGLSKILQSVPKIYQLQPIGNILEEILRELLPLIHSEHAFILIDDFSDDNESSIFRGVGRYASKIDDFMQMLQPEMLAQIGDARTSHQYITCKDGIILPLVAESGNAIGVLYIECNVEKFSDGFDLLKIYASQATASLQNAYLHSMLNIRNAELHQTYELLRQRYMDTIEALRGIVDAKDEYTRGHSDRVSYYSCLIGKSLGIADSDYEILRVGSLFHDIGKIGIPDDILLKNSQLEDREYEEVKKHPQKGAHILSAISMFNDIIPIVLHHHERIDGKGYPQGLRGDEIPFFARIVAIADAFDAMTSNRTYRKKMDTTEAITRLQNGKSTQFDAFLVDIFINTLYRENLVQANISSIIDEKFICQSVPALLHT